MIADVAQTNNDQIVLALIAIIATSVAALVFVIKSFSNIKIAAEQSTQANSAVNNVGPGEHRLYEKVRDIQGKVDKLSSQQETFDSHGWETLPPDLSSAVLLTGTIRDLQYGHKDISIKLDKIIKVLNEHVDWEMSEKYDKEI